MDKLKKIAIDFDINDKLSNFREEFIIPENKIYLDGNSLGLLSKNTLSNLNTTIKEEWGNDLISSWNKSWVNLPKNISRKIASIINSKEEEVYVGDFTREAFESINTSLGPDVTPKSPTLTPHESELILDPAGAKEEVDVGDVARGAFESINLRLDPDYEEEPKASETYVPK